MGRKTVLGALLAALTALIVAAPAAAVPPGFYGLVPQVDPSHDEFARMGQGKVGSYRWPLSWRQIEPTKGTYDFTRTDALMTELALNGIRPVPFVCCVPAFFHEDVKKPPTGQAEEKGWTDWLRAVMQRYGRNGAFWTENPSLPVNPLTDVQIGNEPNSSSFTHPKPDPTQYAHLLEISAKAIHDVDPGAFIVLAGMFGTPHPADGQAIDAWKFLSKIYKRGAKPFFDSAASHPYSGNLAGIKFQIKKFRKVMKRNHDGGADIWITEMGWGSKKHVQSSLGKGRKGQARILKKSFKLLKHKRGKWNIHGIMWFTFKDHDDPTFCTWCDSAGLFSKAFKPKPAWNRFVKFTGGIP
jgi:polysaccharide biosynthesis protein PslG